MRLTCCSGLGGTALTPALSPDESTVYFHATTGVLLAVDSATGTIKWNVTTAASPRQGFYAAPLVDDDGNMYVRAGAIVVCGVGLTVDAWCSYVAGADGDKFNVVQAVSPAGTTLWVSDRLGGQPATMGWSPKSRSIVFGCDTDGSYGTTAYIYALHADSGASTPALRPVLLHVPADVCVMVMQVTLCGATRATPPQDSQLLSMPRPPSTLTATSHTSVWTMAATCWPSTFPPESSCGRTPQGQRAMVVRPLAPMATTFSSTAPPPSAAARRTTSLAPSPPMVLCSGAAGTIPSAAHVLRCCDVRVMCAYGWLTRWVWNRTLMLNSTSSTPFSDPPHGPPTVTADGQVLACIGGTSGWGALFAFTPEVGSLYPPGRATWSYSFTNSPKYDEMGQGTSPILQADNTIYVGDLDLGSVWKLKVAA